MHMYCHEVKTDWELQGPELQKHNFKSRSRIRPHPRDVTGDISDV